jgi:ketosteroid isomerase-like protein
MSLIDRFQAYADAFEVYYQNGDPKVLEPFFTEDAVYETIADPPLAGVLEGREQVFEGLARSLASFDKRFETRALEVIEGPEERDGAVWIRWRVTYTAPGAPPFAMEGEETASFEGERIRRLEDRMPEAGKRSLEWMGAHGAKLKPA